MFSDVTDDDEESNDVFCELTSEFSPTFDELIECYDNLPTSEWGNRLKRS